MFPLSRGRRAEGGVDLRSIGQGIESRDPPSVNKFRGSLEEGGKGVVNVEAVLRSEGPRAPGKERMCSRLSRPALEGLTPSQAGYNSEIARERGREPRCPVASVARVGEGPDTVGGPPGGPTPRSGPDCRRRQKKGFGVASSRTNAICGA